MTVLEIGIVAISIISIIISIYAYNNARKANYKLEYLFKAVSINSKIERSLAKLGEKPKRRYIVFRVEASKKIPGDKIAEALINTGVRILGEVGLAISGLHLVYYDENKNIGVIRVRNTYKYPALAILGMIKTINNDNISIIPLSTSGTLKSAIKKIGKTT